MKNQKTKQILTAVFDIVIGILLLIGGASSFNKMMSIIVTVYAVYLLVIGILLVLKKLFTTGIIDILCGVVLLCLGWTNIAWISTLLLGIYLLILSLYTFVTLKIFPFSSVFTCIIGVLLILISFGNHFAWQFVNVFFYICGAFIIIRGVMNLFGK